MRRSGWSAICRMDSGDKARAKAELERITAGGSKFREFDEAKALLKVLEKRFSPVPEEYRERIFRAWWSP